MTEIAGIPVITSTLVDGGTLAWGIDRTQQRYVLRQGTAVQTFPAIASAVKSAIVAVDDGISASEVTVTGSGPFAISLPATLSHGTDALTGGTTPWTTAAAA